MTTISAREQLLTPRQRRVAARIAVGLTDKQIGAELGISTQTVRVLIFRIARRWGLDATRDIRVLITRIVLRVESSAVND